MDRVYRSKVDWWMWVVVGIGAVAIFASSVSLLVMSPQDGFPTIWVALAQLLLAVFMAWIVFSVSYAINSAALVVRAAFFRWHIPLDRITEVYPTRNPLSSPALSLDRLRVNYRLISGKARWVMISPREREAFLDDLAQAAQLERVENRLVRRA
jgi:hypothetical protein